MMNNNTTPTCLRDLFRGAMLATLIDDALGIPAKGMSADGIRKQCGYMMKMLPAR